jgi:transcriptional regulator with XRE-family HTH domain
MKKLKELRIGNDLSQSELAENLGIAQNTLSQYENGKREPDIATLNIIANYFGVTTDYLIGRNIIEDEELTEYLQELKSRPEMKMLFKLSKNATKEDIEKTVKIIEALKKSE